MLPSAIDSWSSANAALRSRPGPYGSKISPCMPLLENAPQLSAIIGQLFSLLQWRAVAEGALVANNVNAIPCRTGFGGSL